LPEDKVKPVSLPGLFVNGRWQECGGAVVEVLNPATGDELGKICSATLADALLAATAAATTRERWRAFRPGERAKILERIAQVLRRNRSDLARTIVLENGKTLSEAAGEVDWACAFFETYAEEGKRLAGRILPEVPGKQPYVRFEPYGTILAISPWNDPLGMIARQIAPALAAGCTVVWKPASLTPLTARAVADLATEAGLPPGVLNIFITSSSDSCVSSVIRSGLIQKVIFTGSTVTGRRIASAAAAAGIPSNLELGGNAACLVLDGADLPRAAEGIALRKFVQAGQGCTCINRLFVHRRVAEPLLERLVIEASKIRLGYGLDPTVTMGPLIRKEHVERVNGLLASAIAEGARVVWQGEKPKGSDLNEQNFCVPFIVGDVVNDMDLAQQEIFGPVLPVLIFDEEEDAIRRANDVEYGLAGYVYGEMPRALAVAAALEVGLIGVNDASPQAPYYPVGGVKASGWGVAGGSEGLMEYVTHRAISVGA
jgi:succinate-semialdehyde dehydrogenase / glutarate-semialdehyde dehydrogenase